MYFKTFNIGGNQYKVKDEDARNALANKADYEEGVWTPTLDTTKNSPTYYVKSGAYRKVGRIVFCSCMLAFSNISSIEQLRIKSLPYTVLNTFGNYIPIEGTLVSSVKLKSVAGVDESNKIYDICISDDNNYIYPMGLDRLFKCIGGNPSVEYTIHCNFWYITRS